MKIPLWAPSEERTRQANITRFMEQVNARRNLNLDSYADLYQWSVQNIPDFWSEVWNFADIKASKRYDAVVTDLSVFPGTDWFPGARLNFAENLLRYRDNLIAFLFKGETQTSTQMTYAELYDTVARLRRSLKEMGIEVGDVFVILKPPSEWTSARTKGALIEKMEAALSETVPGVGFSNRCNGVGPSMTASTPGIFSAFEVSMLLIFACAYGLRTMSM